MAPIARAGVAVLVLVVLAVAAAGLYFWKRPLDVLARLNRRALGKAGLELATAETGFGRQSYWTGGQGPTLVLLHGAGDQAGTWSGVVDALAPRYRLVVPDLAGHGASAPASGPISVKQVLRGVEAVLSQGPQDPVILVGNSLGAWIAMLYAHEHPARVARIILVNGGPLRGDRTDLSLTPKTREEAAALMTQLRDPRSGAIPAYVLDDVVRAAASGPLARLAQTAGEMESLVLDGRLQEVAAPVNLIWGTSDKLFSTAYAERMMRDLRASRLTAIEACGHVPHVECPIRFKSVLLDILQQPAPSVKQH